MTIPKNHDTLPETNHKSMKTCNLSHKEMVVLRKLLKKKKESSVSYKKERQWNKIRKIIYK